MSVGAEVQCEAVESGERRRRMGLTVVLTAAVGGPISHSAISVRRPAASGDQRRADPVPVTPPPARPLTPTHHGTALSALSIPAHHARHARCGPPKRPKNAAGGGSAWHGAEAIAARQMSGSRGQPGHQPSAARKCHPDSIRPPNNHTRPPAASVSSSPEPQPRVRASSAETAPANQYHPTRRCMLARATRNIHSTDVAGSETSSVAAAQVHISQSTAP